MRAELVLGAMPTTLIGISCRAVSQGTRKLHRPKTRLQIQRTLCLSNYVTGTRSLIADVTGVSTFNGAAVY
jgi:hypothetical protein